MSPLGNTKASSQDKISGRMLKATATNIVTPVTKLFNKLTFPKEMGTMLELMDKGNIPLTTG